MVFWSGSSRAALTLIILALINLHLSRCQRATNPRFQNYTQEIIAHLQGIWAFGGAVMYERSAKEIICYYANQLFKKRKKGGEDLSAEGDVWLL